MACLPFSASPHTFQFSFCSKDAIPEKSVVVNYEDAGVLIHPEGGSRILNLKGPGSNTRYY